MRKYSKYQVKVFQVFQLDFKEVLMDQVTLVKNQLRQASYENKARLLLMITENYQRSIADEIRVAADKIQLELLPKMKEYQEQAKR